MYSLDSDWNSARRACTFGPTSGGQYSCALARICKQLGCAHSDCAPPLWADLRSAPLATICCWHLLARRPQSGI